MLAGVLLLIIVCRGSGLTQAAAALAGACLVALPLCGANDLALVPALGLWFGYMGARHLRSPTPADRRAGLVTLVGVVAAVSLVPLSFLGYASPPWHGDRHHLGNVLLAAGQFLSAGFGPSADRLWPLSGFGVLALLVATAVVLAATVRRQPLERCRALGLLAFLAAMTSLAFGLGWGRSDAFVLRYVTLAVPALCCVYFTWLLYLPRPIGPPLTAGLCVVVALLLPVNARTGLVYAQARQRQMAAFEGDVRAKVPIFLLAKRHATFLLLSHQEYLVHYLGALHRSGFEPLRNLQEDPPFHAVKLDVTPAASHEVRWQNGSAEAVGVDSYLDFRLPEPQFVYRLQIGYTHSNREGSWAHLRVCWKRANQADFPPDQRYARHSLETGSDKTVAIAIGDSIDQIRVYPDDKPCTFRVQDLELQVPVTEG